MFQDILNKDDLKAINLLINDYKMVGQEKRYYITSVDWKNKLLKLKEKNKKVNFFSEDDIQAIKLLINDREMNSMERLHYIEGSNIKEKVSELIRDRNLLERKEEINKHFDRKLNKLNL